MGNGSDYTPYKVIGGVYFCEQCDSPLVPVKCRQLRGKATRCGNGLYTCTKCCPEREHNCCGCDGNEYDDGY